MLQQCFDQLGDHPFVNPSPTPPPPPPPAMLCTKKDSFLSISFTSEHCLWWESLKFYWYPWRVPNTSDLLCSLSSTLKSNINFLCCQWHGVNLQAIFQQLFGNYCIYKSDTAVAEQCQNQCIALIALTNLSDKIKLVNGLIFQLNMTD